MKHKIILLTIIILSVIVLSGCTEPMGAGTGAGAREISKEIIKNPADCIDMTSEAEKIACFTKSAAYKKDIDICIKNIDEGPLRDGCIMAVALAKGDKDLCDLMSNMTKDTTSQDKMCKAMITLDTAYCDQIKTMGGMGQSQMIGACYAFIVEKTKNTKICEQLSSEIAKSYCYLAAADITGDLGYCQMIPKKSQKNDCYFNYATSTGKWQYCANITDEYGYKEDIKQCYTIASIKAQDHKGCMNLGDPNECLIGILKIEKDISICPKMFGSPYIDWCYYFTVPELLEGGHVSDCNAIPDKLVRYGCMIAFAEKESDTKICKGIPDSYIEHIECYAKAFTSETSSRACDKFKDDESLWKTCNDIIAKNAKDIGTCNKIKHEPSRILCTALVEKNWRICENIVFGKWDPYGELRYVSTCKIEVALMHDVADLGNALDICDTIHLTEYMKSRIKEMNNLRPSEVEEKKKECREKIISHMMRSGYPKAAEICKQEGGRLSDDGRDCWVKKWPPKEKYSYCFTEDCVQSVREGYLSFIYKKHGL